MIRKWILRTFVQFGVGVIAFFPHALASSIPKKVDVLVIGAGLSGLTAAYELTKKTQMSFQVLEASPRVGGRVRTVRYERPGEPVITADSGMEEYWESNPAVNLLKELKLPVRSDFAASSLFLQGKLELLGPDEDSQSYLKRILSPVELKSLEEFKLKASSIYERIRGAMGPFNLGRLPDDLIALKELSFEQWVSQQGVATRVREWIRISIECETGTHWNRFSALDGLAEFHIFFGKGELSYRVIGGNEKFTDALAQRAGKNRIHLNTLVKSIETLSPNRVRVTYLNTESNRSGQIEARHVISTIPLFRLFDVQFLPALSEEKQNAIRSQTWGSYFKAHVFLPRVAERFWTQKGESTLPLLSDSDLGVIYEGNPDDPSDTRILSLLVSGDVAEGFNFMPSDVVRTRILKGLEGLWPGIGKEIRGMEFYRIHPRAIAGWPVGRSRFDSGSRALREPENSVYFAGDFTESTHSDGAVISAQRVVSQIRKAEGK